MSAARPDAPVPGGRLGAAAARTATDALLALTFLTRVPAPAARDLRAAELGRAVVWFPLVGALVGGVLGGTRLLADLALPPGPATAIAIAAAILVTGALHEDGLADTADGLGAHATRDRRLEIMRDPRVGTFGASALVLSLLLAWSLLSRLDGVECLLAAVTAHTLARWAMPVAAAAFRPARPDGAGALLGASTPRLLLAAAVAVAIAVAAAQPLAAAAAVIAVLAATAVVGACAALSLGGTTGDVYGAVGKTAELAAYAVLVAFWV